MLLMSLAWEREEQRLTASPLPLTLALALLQPGEQLCAAVQTRDEEEDDRMKVILGTEREPGELTSWEGLHQETLGLGGWSGLGMGLGGWSVPWYSGEERKQVTCPKNLLSSVR